MTAPERFDFLSSGRAVQSMIWRKKGVSRWKRMLRAQRVN